MAWVAVDKDGTEWIFDVLPERYFRNSWGTFYYKANIIELPQGTIEKIIGYKISWKNKPVELK